MQDHCPSSSTHHTDVPVFRIGINLKDLPLLAEGNCSRVYALSETRALKVVAHRAQKPHVHRSVCSILLSDYESGVHFTHGQLIRYHSYVPNALFADSATPCCFIEMDRCQTDFYEHFISSARRRTKEELVAAFAQVVEALAHMHAQGYAHNDIKPENIFVDADKGAILADFGYTCCQDAFTNAQKRAMWNVRDLSYAAPEILDLIRPAPQNDAEKSQQACHGGDAAFDERPADLFALGQTLFACLFRTYPRKYQLVTPQDPYYSLVARGDAKALLARVTHDT